MAGCVAKAAKAFVCGANVNPARERAGVRTLR